MLDPRKCEARRAAQVDERFRSRGYLGRIRRHDHRIAVGRSEQNEVPVVPDTVAMASKEARRFFVRSSCSAAEPRALLDRCLDDPCFSSRSRRRSSRSEAISRTSPRERHEPLPQTIALLLQASQGEGERVATAMTRGSPGRRRAWADLVDRPRAGEQENLRGACRPTRSARRARHARSERDLVVLRKPRARRGETRFSLGGRSCKNRSMISIGLKTTMCPGSPRWRGARWKRTASPSAGGSPDRSGTMHGLNRVA